jgi:hypothetical protein
MKDQYVGDVNDFFKYDLLETIEKTFDKEILVVWMRTKSEGMDIEYEKYAPFNPSLFSELQKIIKSNNRNIESIELIYSNYKYQSSFLETCDRTAYFSQVEAKSEKCDLIFFDPDIGISMRSDKKDTEHLYWDEIKKFWKLDKDLLIYQHSKRQTWDDYLADLNQFMGDLPGAFLVPIKTKNVMFIYLAHKDIKEELAKALNKWNNLVQIFDVKTYKITADDGKIFSYTVDKSSDTSGYSMYTSQIISPINSRLKIITSEMIREIYLMSEELMELEQCNLDKEALIGKYFDSDGNIYYTVDDQVYKFTLTLKYFEKFTV